VDGLANSHNNRIFQVKYIDQDENALLSAGTDRNVMLWDIRAKGIQ
jgi:WD40 repeat protein